ncbi:MAG TPA: hypothetical protein VJS15_04065 [Allosphingosinicella sp.]|nr:hypothetical protein [Allosphingosinicella sp.]
MRALAVFPLLLLSAATSGAANGEIRLDQRKGCGPLDSVRRAEGDSAGRLQRLDRLPPGDLDLAVSRMFEGCPESVTVAENFGSVEGPRRARPQLRQPVPPRTRLLGR